MINLNVELTWMPIDKSILTTAESVVESDESGRRNAIDKPAVGHRSEVMGILESTSMSSSVYCYA